MKVTPWQFKFHPRIIPHFPFFPYCGEHWAFVIYCHSFSISIQPYLHESRHRHALNRVRGSGGRFLSTKKLQQQASVQGDISGQNNHRAQGNDLSIPATACLEMTSMTGLNTFHHPDTGVSGICPVERRRSGGALFDASGLRSSSVWWSGYGAIDATVTWQGKSSLALLIFTVTYCVLVDTFGALETTTDVVGSIGCRILLICVGLCVSCTLNRFCKFKAKDILSAVG